MHRPEGEPVKKIEIRPPARPRFLEKSARVPDRCIVNEP